MSPSRSSGIAAAARASALERALQSLEASRQRAQPVAELVAGDVTCQLFDLLDALVADGESHDGVVAGLDVGAVVARATACPRPATTPTAR